MLMQGAITSPIMPLSLRVLQVMTPEANPSRGRAMSCDVRLVAVSKAISKILGGPRSRPQTDRKATRPSPREIGEWWRIVRQAGSPGIVNCCRPDPSG